MPFDFFDPLCTVTVRLLLCRRLVSFLRCVSTRDTLITLLYTPSLQDRSNIHVLLIAHGSALYLLAFAYVYN